MSWKEGLTEKQAQIFSQRQDRINFYNKYMQNTDAFSLASISGMIVGSIPDPINYIPFLGWSNRIRQTTNIIHKIPALQMSANAMLGQTAFEVVKQGSRYNMGADIQWKAATIDVALAGLIGAGAGVIFGGIGSKSGLSKKISEYDDPNNLNLTLAGVHLHNSEPVKNALKNTDINNPITTIKPIEDTVNVNLRQEQINLNKKETLDIEQNIDVSQDYVVPEVMNNKDNILANVLRKTKTCLNKFL